MDMKMQPLHGWHCPAFSAKVRNEWSCTATPPHACTATLHSRCTQEQLLINIIYLMWSVSSLHCRSLCLFPRHCMWDLWWADWHWDRFFFKCCSFPLSVFFYQCFILVFILLMTLLYYHAS